MSDSQLKMSEDEAQREKSRSFFLKIFTLRIYIVVSVIKADSIAITITIDFARISILSRNRVRTNHVRCVFALDFVLWCRTIENLHSKRVCCYIDFFDFCPGRARSAINDFAANQRSWKNIQRALIHFVFIHFVWKWKLSFLSPYRVCLRVDIPRTASELIVTACECSLSPCSLLRPPLRSHSQSANLNAVN